MTGSRLTTRLGVTGVAVALVLVAGSRAVPLAQTRDTASAESLRQAEAQTQALRDLVGEVRALRGVIESYTQGQIQSQTMTELLTVQQRRLADATTRLDVTRRELDGAASEVRRLAAEVSDFEDGVRQITDAARRRVLEEELPHRKQALDRQVQQEQQLRQRESELLSAVGLEEAKWNELVDRINRSLAR